MLDQLRFLDLLVCLRRKAEVRLTDYRRQKAWPDVTIMPWCHH